MKAYFELHRCRQWIKNCFVLAPLFFGRELFHLHALQLGIAAAAAFSLLCSAIYIFNDWRDIEADRLHATNKKRPLPSGRMTPSVALSVMVCLLIGTAAITMALRLPFPFISILCLYAFINLLYSMGLKQVAVLELFMVSSGFVSFRPFRAACSITAATFFAWTTREAWLPATSVA
jgi:decaprenyl-phosphate phosphoribosyltransferase